MFCDNLLLEDLKFLFESSKVDEARHIDMLAKDYEQLMEAQFQLQAAVWDSVERGKFPVYS